MLNRATIEGHANRFRRAIELVLSSSANQLPVGFHAFPFGSCGDASLQLAAYLAAVGASKVTYVSGRRTYGEFQSHAWLVVDGLNVDITGDQFDRSAVTVADLDDVWFSRTWQVDTRIHHSDDAFEKFAQNSMHGHEAVLLALASG